MELYLCEYGSLLYRLQFEEVPLGKGWNSIYVSTVQFTPLQGSSGGHPSEQAMEFHLHALRSLLFRFHLQGVPLERHWNSIYVTKAC